MNQQNDQHLREHIDRRFDRIEESVEKLSEKLDNYSSRLSSAETSIEWIRGHLAVGTTIIVAALTGMAAVIYSYLTK